MQLRLLICFGKYTLQTMFFFTFGWTSYISFPIIGDTQEHSDRVRQR